MAMPKSPLQEIKFSSPSSGMLRRLHVSQHHRARKTHHSERQRGQRTARDRDDRDEVPGFTGRHHDLGGPTAIYVSHRVQIEGDESACRKPSCVVSRHLPQSQPDHSADPAYRNGARAAGVKEILIAEAVRYDLAIESPEYVKELATHHVGGYLKIAPEAIGEGPLVKMRKPGVGTYHKFKELFDKYSKLGAKEQYLIPYFMPAHPGTTDKDMLELALWLKGKGFRGTRCRRPAFSDGDRDGHVSHAEESGSGLGEIAKKRDHPKGIKQRRRTKGVPEVSRSETMACAREALRQMEVADLIGNGKDAVSSGVSARGTGDFDEGKRGGGLTGRSRRSTRGCRRCPAIDGKPGARPDTSDTSDVSGHAG